ncbi:hypothetical protein SDC9_147616 [bioreactor metagenome]|uniref:VWA-like domain-containing protein n=1 Tax=bioreactor metagenome TaxID=1076179 RepID=A0A645EEV1_9ZZZZ
MDALLAVDESGSISDEMVKAFFAELFEINKIIGGNFFVTVFDTMCKEPVSLNKFILDSEREKRGGTDYRPVFALADRLKMPLVILFTDGDGQMPDSVNQNTLWVLTKNTRQEMAFGYSVPFER